MGDRRGNDHRYGTEAYRTGFDRSRLAKSARAGSLFAADQTGSAVGLVWSDIRDAVRPHIPDTCACRYAGEAVVGKARALKIRSLAYSTPGSASARHDDDVVEGAWATRSWRESVSPYLYGHVDAIPAKIPVSSTSDLDIWMRPGGLCGRRRQRPR